MTTRREMKALFGRLGFSDAAATFFVVDQRLDDLETLRDLDEEHVTSLCKLCRKPGGTIVNPDMPTGPGAANFTGPKTISNPGIPVALREEINFGLCIFYLKYLQMTSRTITRREITPTLINTVRIFRKELENAEAPPPETAPKLTSKRIFDFFDDFRDHLHDHVGMISKRPLSYVVRKELVVMGEALDPPFGSTDSNYTSHRDEIENRAPIVLGDDITKFDPVFVQDNHTVWKILWSIVKDTQYVTYVKPFVSKQDGRGAYESLYNTLLGPQAINNHASTAENKLQSMTLDGTKKKNWSFDKYVIAHKEQHIILEKLVKHGYAGIDENSKVRLFLLGITDPKLAVMKSSLCTLKGTDFDSVVASFRNYIETNRTVEKQTRTLHIAQVNSNGYKNSQRTSKAGPDSDNYKEGGDYSRFKIDVRYYKTKEWNALKPGQRNFLREAKRKEAMRKATTNADLKRTNEKLTDSDADGTDDTVSSTDSTKPKKKKLKTLRRGDTH